MIQIYFIILFTSLYAQKKKVDPNEKYLTELQIDNFYKTIQKEDYVLVDFYTNWCQHCKEFEPELNRLAKMCFDQATSEISIQVAKFNMEEDADRSIGNKYQIRYFPTLILFYKGIPVEYKDDKYKQASSIFKWMQQIIKSSNLKRIENEDQIEEHIQNNQFSTILYGVTDPQNDSLFWIFHQVALTQEGNDFEIEFGYVVDEVELIRNYAPHFGCIIAYKYNQKGQIEQKIYPVQNFNQENLQRFYIQLVYSSVIPFSDPGYDLLRGSRSPGMILFVNFQPESQKAEQEYKKFAEENQSLIFTLAKFTDSNFWSQLENMGFTDPELPKLLILKYQQGQGALKYRYDRDSISLEGLREFVQDYKDQKLSKQYFSAPLPLMNDGLIQDWVGLNFKEQIKNAKKDVVVFLYQSNYFQCQLCKEVLEMYEEFVWDIGQQNSQNFKFSKVDLMYNEVPLTILQLPMMYLYREQMKRIPVHFEGNFSRTAMTQFIKWNSEKQLIY